MTVQLKSALILGTTLVVGILIGALATGAWTRHRMRQLNTMRTQPGLVHAVERTVQPTDSVQARAVREAVRRTADRIGAINRRNRGEIAAQFDSLQAELRPILTDEQMQRLVEARARSRQRYRDGRRRGGGGPRRDRSNDSLAPDPSAP